MNILNKYEKSGIVQTDDLSLDSPRFEIIGVNIDTVNKVLQVEVLHYANQGSIEQKHSRTFEVNFTGLPASVKQAGKGFLDSIEAEILKLPQYQNATKL